jgi:hypothetical protein
VALLQVVGETVTLVNDGTDWFVTSPEAVPPELRVWDSTAAEFRQATSLQDAFDSVHTLVGSVVDSLKTQGVELPFSLEAFDAALGR